MKILKTKSTTLSDDLFLCQISKGSAVRFPFNIFCTLVTMATAAILNFFNPQKLPHTTVDIPTKFHEVWRKESNFFLNPPFLFPWQLRKVCPTYSDFFGLSRSTRCGCCSYQVSSISVLRGTCYDHFCFFSFFLHFGRFYGNGNHFEKNQPLKAQLHMAYDIPTRFHKVLEMCRTNFWRKKERKKERKRRIIIRNGANTICLPNFVWEP